MNTLDLKVRSSYEPRSEFLIRDLHIKGAARLYTRSFDRFSCGILRPIMKGLQTARTKGYKYLHGTYIDPKVGI